MAESGTVIDLSELQQQLELQESQYSELRQGTQALIQWHQPYVKSQYVILYIHGLSASRQELDPLPEGLAHHLKANIYYVRLSGHGLPGIQLGRASCDQWIQDAEQAVELAGQLGDQIIVMASSTGATLTEHLLQNKAPIKAAIYLSPNFGVRHPVARLVGWPLSHVWLPWFIGREYNNFSETEIQKIIWTQIYPVSVFWQLKKLIKRVKRQARKHRENKIKVPVLSLQCPMDKVVSYKAAYRLINESHENHKIISLRGIPGERNHVLTGNAMKPENNDLFLEHIFDFVDSLIAASMN